MEKKPLLIDNKWEPNQYLIAISRAMIDEEEKIGKSQARIVLMNAERQRVEALIKEHEE